MGTSQTCIHDKKKGISALCVTMWLGAGRGCENMSDRDRILPAVRLVTRALMQGAGYRPTRCIPDSTFKVLPPHAADCCDYLWKREDCSDDCHVTDVGSSGASDDSDTAMMSSSEDENFQ